MTVAGWYPDPLAPATPSPDGAPVTLRWWSGEAWTEEVHVPPPDLAPALIAQLTAAEAATPMPTTAPTPEIPPGPFRTVVPEQRRYEGRHCDVWLPPTFAENGQLPWVCPEHGNPATRMQKVRVTSKTPPWAFVLILAGLIVFAVVALALRETVTGYWPVCARCEHQRQRLRHYMWLAVGGIFAFVGLGMLLGSVLPLLFSAVAIVAWLVLHDLGSWLRLTRADAVRGSRTLHVRAPAPAFVYALPALPNRAPGRGVPGTRPPNAGVVVGW